MAVVPTGQIFNWLTFGGVSSADYGIYITGEGVYNAPERAVELTQIPGRNGAIPIDLGRWENIEVVYPASTGTMSQADFRTALSDFRNAIASQRGYQRLEDTYHPDEYRMGLFVNGLEVEPTAQGRAGEFDLVFNCKPQRFLTSGETAVAVANGGSIDNPTELDASPLLAIEGYGAVSFAGYSVEVDNAVMGPVEVLSNEVISTNSASVSFTKAGIYNDGDTLSVTWTSLLGLNITGAGKKVTSATVTSPPPNGSVRVSTTDYMSGSRVFYTYTPNASTTFDTSQATTTVTDSYAIRIVTQDGTTYTDTITVTIRWMRTASGGRIYISSVGAYFVNPGAGQGGTIISAVVDSSVSILGNPTYIDCDLGLAYKIVSDEVISLNSYIALGSELPVLPPGSTTFTVAGTISSFKVTPRWWRL